MENHNSYTENESGWISVNCPKCGTVNSMPPDTEVGEFCCRECSTPVSLENAHEQRRHKIILRCPACGRKMMLPADRGLMQVSCSQCAATWYYSSADGESYLTDRCSQCGGENEIAVVRRYYPYVCRHCGRVERSNKGRVPVSAEEMNMIHRVEGSVLLKRIAGEITALLSSDEKRGGLISRGITSVMLEVDRYGCALCAPSGEVIYQHPFDGEGDLGVLSFSVAQGRAKELLLQGCLAPAYCVRVDETMSGEIEIR